MNNQSPNPNHQINSNTQYPNNQTGLVIDKLVIGYYLIIGAWLLEFYLK